jgi:hypothetical protein
VRLKSLEDQKRIENLIANKNPKERVAS